MKGPTEGIYRRLSVRMYSDEKFMRLSPLLPSGQGLWVYLITGPHTSAIPGVFVVGRAALAETLNWPFEAFSKAFDEVIAEGLAQFDERTRLWFIPNAIHHNMPANPNVVRSWRAAWALLPECDMRGVIAIQLEAALRGLSEPFAKAFEEVTVKPSNKAPSKGSPKQEAGSRKQEEEKASPAAQPDRQKASRLPKDWTLPDAWAQQAESERPDLTPQKIALIAAEFRDYWIAKPGKEGRKLDWEATWRNWVRREQRFDAGRGAGKASPPPQRFELGADEQLGAVA
jgi:hypothetical protein